MRILAVAAMAYPTRQGTQALVREQALALSARGHDVHLLCYAASAYDEKPPFRVHRIGGWPALRSFRSGPLPQKPILDLRLAAAARRLVRAISPDVVLAHHVEALAACAWPRVTAPLVYHAHTRLDLELPRYLPISPRFHPGIGRAAERAERALAGRADRVVAVSPDLASFLGAVYVPPTILPSAPTGEAVDGEVVYQGNLDHYQGIDVLLDAWALLARRRPETLKIVTASETGTLLAEIRRRGLARRVEVEPLGDLAAARRRLARSAVVAVPRALPGGFPIKLLEGLASGRPVVVSKRAAHGLADGVQAKVVPDDDRVAFADAIEGLLRDKALAERIGASGRTHVLENHGVSALMTLEAELRVVAR